VAIQIFRQHQRSKYALVGRLDRRLDGPVLRGDLRGWDGYDLAPLRPLELPGHEFAETDEPKLILAQSREKRQLEGPNPLKPNK